MKALEIMRERADRKTDSEGRADEVEKKKQEQLQKQKDGKGHWEEQLASDSESIVRQHTTRQPQYMEHILGS
jgi:hypothetical protein